MKKTLQGRWKCDHCGRTYLSFFKCSVHEQNCYYKNKWFPVSGYNGNDRSETGDISDK